MFDSKVSITKRATYWLLIVWAVIALAVNVTPSDNWNSVADRAPHTLPAVADGGQPSVGGG